MPTFEVSFSRAFVIKIQAKTSKDAAELSEFFLGYKDDSTEFEKEEYGFEFKEIDMTVNEVLEVSEVRN
jgi:hypothetical protein